MPYKYCQHVKESGIFCSSPAVRGRDYCYYHARTRARRLAIAKAQSESQPWHLELPPLEDMHAVQTAVTNVIEALVAGALDCKRAGLILYGLQQASNNVRLTVWGSDSHFVVHDYDERRVDHYPGLEAEFGLPKSVDLDAVPEVAFPPPPEPDVEAIFPPKKPPVSIQGLKAWKKVLAEAEQELKAQSS